MAEHGASRPIRTCVGCRRARPADELVRVALGPDGGLVIGRELPGRGAWLCPERPGCLERAVRSKSFERALRRTSFEPWVFEQLSAAFVACAGNAEGVGR